MKLDDIEQILILASYGYGLFSSTITYIITWAQLTIIYLTPPTLYVWLSQRALRNETASNTIKTTYCRVFICSFLWVGHDLRVVCKTHRIFSFDKILKISNFIIIHINLVLFLKIIFLLQGNRHINMNG